jgi:dihydroorotate dehydrogenase (fumarate)
MLNVEYARLSLKNPVIVASATPSINTNCIKKAARAGAGAIVTKSVIFPDKNGKPAGVYPRPRFMLMNNSSGYNPNWTEKGGFYSLFRMGEPYPTPEEMRQMLNKVKSSKEVDCPIIVSICAAAGEYDSWIDLAKQMENAGADALELNMHCWPVIKTSDPFIVKAVKDNVNIPVIPKLMAINDDSAKVAAQMKMAGADAIAGLGTFGFRGLEIDIEKERPYLGTYHGLGGSWLRSVSLAYMARIAETTDLQISGVTGVQTWEDAIKYFLIGAITVQICGAIYSFGYKAISDINEGIKKYMNIHGYKSIDGFRGKALKNIKPAEYAPPVKARVILEKCIGCRKCENVCLWDAISILEGGKAVINAEKCDGCGICWSLCPSKAIEMYRIEE